MPTSSELRSRADIIEAREKLDIAIRDIQNKCNAEMQPLKDELAKLRQECPHPGKPYDSGNGTTLDWSCPDCQVRL